MQINNIFIIIEKVRRGGRERRRGEDEGAQRGEEEGEERGGEGE